MAFQLTETTSTVSLDDVIDPSACAVLVIDMQKDLLHPNYAKTIEHIAALVASARAAGCYVVYVKNRVLDRDQSSSTAERTRRLRLGLNLNVTMDGTEGQEVVDELKPLAGDPVVFKHRLDAFHGTSLDMLLRVRGVSTVIITGVATHGCVTATSYASQSRDYNVVVARDCVASWDQSVHEACIKVLESVMGFVADSTEIVKRWSLVKPTAR